MFNLVANPKDGYSVFVVSLLFMHGSRKFCQRGSNSTLTCFFFFVYLFFFLILMRERKDPNTTKSGPSSALQRNTISIAFRWRADNGPTCHVIFQGIRTSIAKKPYSYVIFSGERVRIPCPLFIRACNV